MQIFVMRHGEAHFNAPSDSERTLTSLGETMTLNVASWLAKNNGKIKRVLVSPYIRAQQTLAILRKNLSLPTEVETMTDLTPNGDERNVVNYLHVLAEAKQIDSVLIVSHLPLVGELVSLLCPHKTPPLFYTSTVACINYDALNQIGELKWVYHAK